MTCPRGEVPWQQSGGSHLASEGGDVGRLGLGRERVERPPASRQRGPDPLGTTCRRWRNRTQFEKGQRWRRPMQAPFPDVHNAVHNPRESCAPPILPFTSPSQIGIYCYVKLECIVTFPLPPLSLFLRVRGHIWGITGASG